MSRAVVDVQGGKALKNDWPIATENPPKAIAWSRTTPCYPAPEPGRGHRVSRNHLYLKRDQPVQQQHSSNLGYPGSGGHGQGAGQDLSGTRQASHPGVTFAALVLRSSGAQGTAQPCVLGFRDCLLGGQLSLGAFKI